MSKEVPMTNDQAQAGWSCATAVSAVPAIEGARLTQPWHTRVRWILGHLNLVIPWSLDIGHWSFRDSRGGHRLLTEWASIARTIWSCRYFARPFVPRGRLFINMQKLYHFPSRALR